MCVRCAVLSTSQLCCSVHPSAAVVTQDFYWPSQGTHFFTIPEYGNIEFSEEHTEVFKHDPLPTQRGKTTADFLPTRKGWPRGLSSLLLAARVGQAAVSFATGS